MQPKRSAPIEVADAPAPDKSRFRFQRLLAPFAAKKAVVTPIVWFFLDWLVLAATIGTSLIVDSWWVRVFAALVGGLWIARRFVIGHDACHGSYTPSKTLNGWTEIHKFGPAYYVTHGVIACTADSGNDLITDKRFLPYLEPLRESWMHNRFKAQEINAFTGNQQSQSFTIAPDGESIPFSLVWQNTLYAALYVTLVLLASSAVFSGRNLK